MSRRPSPILACVGIFLPFFKFRSKRKEIGRSGKPKLCDVALYLRKNIDFSIEFLPRVLESNLQNYKERLLLYDEPFTGKSGSHILTTNTGSEITSLVLIKPVFYPFDRIYPFQPAAEKIR